jgi:hypothetical protein
MHMNRSFLSIACRAVTFSFLVAGTVSRVQAQQAASGVQAAPSTFQLHPVEPLFLASASTPADSSSSSIDTSDTSNTASSSSSSSSSSDAILDKHFDLSTEAFGASQPPPRRRYGRPNYSDSHTNADGSDKWVFIGGIGFTLPVGDTHIYDTTSYGFQVGGGRQWNKKVSLLAQFDYDHFNLTGGDLGNESYIDNYCTVAEYNAGLCFPEGPAPASNAIPVGGNAHVWSFTLNPTYTLPTSGSLGGYLVAGGGYYHKVTNFTTPEVEGSPIFGEYEVESTFDHYTSNAPGVSGGFGITYKFSHFSGERFYAEARYVLIFDQQRYGVTAANVATSPLSATNFFPANSNRTTYIPVKFGIRF